MLQSFSESTPFKGKATKTHAGLLKIEVNNVQLLAPSAPYLAGKNVIVTIKPENITISKSTDLDFSGASWNSIEGTITEIVQMRSTAQVTVDTGFLLKTRLPLNLIKNLDINIGDKVHLWFNVDSLNVFEDKSG